MWVMAPFGILMPSIRPADTVSADDNRHLQVRARRARELDILRKEYMGDQLGPTLFTPGFDYEYRAYCTHEAFGRAMFDLTMAIDYTKFKPTTDRYNDNELHSVYNSIWSTMFSSMSTKIHQREYATGTAYRKGDVQPRNSRRAVVQGTRRRGNRWGQGVEEYLDAVEGSTLGSQHSNWYDQRELGDNEEFDYGDENYGQQWNTTGGDWTRERGIPARDSRDVVGDWVDGDEDEKDRVDALLAEAEISLGGPAPVAKTRIGDSAGETLGKSYTRRAKANGAAGRKGKAARPGSVLPSEIAPRKVKRGQDPFGGVTINHGECDHPATSAAQKQCRQDAIRAWHDAQADMAGE